MSKTKPKAGRPAGTANRPTPVVRVTAPRCTACGSTKTDRSLRIGEIEHAGFDDDGQLYTHIITHRRRCICSQWRMEKVYENRPADDQ